MRAGDLPRRSVCWIHLLLPVLLATAGCASRGEIEAFQRDLTLLGEQLHRVEGRQEQQDSLLVARVEFLKDRLRENELVLRTMKADQLQTAEELLGLIQTLRAMFEDAGGTNRRLAQKVDELNLILARQGLRQDRDSQAPADPAWLYNQATLDLYRGFPELARAGFREYLGRYPEGDMAHLCMYWIADTWISEQQPDSAWRALTHFEERHPDSPRLPASLLRRALILAGAGKEAESVELLERVIREYPESAEARIARQRVAESTRAGEAD